jgi:hypothetical protein
MTRAVYAAYGVGLDGLLRKAKGGEAYRQTLKATLPEVQSEQTNTGLGAGHVADAVTRLFDRPFALFGWSMGAPAAFEVTGALAREGCAPPSRLFAASHPPPPIEAGALEEPLAPSWRGPFALQVFAAKHLLREER